MATWIKLHRPIREHWIWENPKYLWAWVDLIMLCEIDEKKKLVGKDVVQLKRGQAVASSGYLAERWGWGRQQVRTFIKLLEKDEMLTRQLTNNNTVITLLNYSKYQDKPTTNVTSGQPTPNQPLTIKERSIEDKEKNIYPQDFEEFWNIYPRKIEKANALSCWKARVKEGHSPDKLIEAARLYSKSKAAGDPEFVKYPATFLSNKKPFLDYVATPKAEKKSGIGCPECNGSGWIFKDELNGTIPCKCREKASVN